MLSFKQAQRFFFDRDSVLKRIGRARVKVLSKAGAFVRRRAQTSMRYRKGASQVGKPPNAHPERGALLRKWLYFSYDPLTDACVVGPVGARRGEAPRLNEFGGAARRRGKTVTYPARPFMFPAMEEESPKLPEYWSDSVRSDT